MAQVWKAPENVSDLIAQLSHKYHGHLENLNIAATFVDGKPFAKNRFNWGKVTKFSNYNKLWQGKKIDFSIDLCADGWGLLNGQQQEALLDLHLTRIVPEYVPEVIVENGKKIKVIDDLGRVKYTTEIKVDENGDPKWLVEPLDLVVFAKNVRRYGLWMKELVGIDGLWDNNELQ